MLLFLLAGLLACAAPPAGAQTAAEENEGLRSATGAGAGEILLRWWGRAGRTYFIQTSDDLISWTYVPVIESGTDALLEWGFTTSAPRLFLRLQHTDTTYTGPVAQADFDGDKVVNLEELVNNTNPLSTSDLDGDQMPRDWEVAMGLNPNDALDRLGDLDGDRIPNLFEFKRGTSAADPASLPAVDRIVAPSGGGTHTSINAAVVSLPSSTNHYYGIVLIKPGTYQELVGVGDLRRVLLLPETAGTVKLGSSSGRALSVSTLDFVARDMIFEQAVFRDNHQTVYVGLNYGSAPLAQAQAAFVNCIFKNSGVCVPAPMLVGAGTVVDQCTFTGNVAAWNSSATANGSSIKLSDAANGTGRQHLVLRNSILWNPTSLNPVEVAAPAGTLVTATNNLIRGGAYGGLDQDPLLDHNGRLMPGSPAIRSGSHSPPFPIKDVDGEVRMNLHDLGADEFQDADLDGLLDWWELRIIGHMAADGDDDLDADGLGNAQEYHFDSHPLLADTDGDGASDGAEHAAQTHPRKTDTDGDGMLDGFEITHQLRPLDPRDSLEDKDGDRIPNLYEQAKGTLPNDASSKPAADVVVDSSQPVSANVKTTIAAAQARVTQLGLAFGIIRVHPGTTGSYAENVVLDDGPVLLLAEAGAVIPAISGSSSTGEAMKIQSADCVVDGFILRHANPAVVDEGVLCQLAKPDAQGRLVNCLVTGNKGATAAGVRVFRGEATLAHCTVFANRRSAIQVNPVLGIEVAAEGRLRLQNSIVWNDDGYPGGLEVAVLGGGIITVTNSIIRGGAFGGMNVNPQLDGAGRLMAFSPAINPVPSVVLPVSSKDGQGEPRDSAPDIGADEFYDSDADGLPDWWEQGVFGSLAQTGGGDNDLDGLTNFGEYLAGLNPLVADTDGDGVGDLAEAVAEAGTAYYYAGSTAVDADGDGLSLAQELLLGSDPNAADSNGDGIPDGAAWSLGLSLTGDDPDGDGVLTAVELVQGTSPILADTDGDGVSDLLDAFPLDPTQSSLAGGGDMAAPEVLLTKPADAILIP